MSENSRPGGSAGIFLSRVQAKKAVTVATVGLVSGVSVIIGEIALATLVFSGDLAPYLSQGIGLVLFGILAGCVVIALFSGFLGAVSAPAVPTMLMLAVIGGSLTATGDELFPTMVAIIVLCSMATAVCALLIARFRLANLVRFIPYPVSSGFVAGTGGVACWVALSLMGMGLDADALARLFDPLVAANWGIGVAYGFGLYFATQRWKSFLLMPVSFIAVTGLCHLGLAASGVTQGEAEAAGLLFSGLSEANLWPPVTPDDAARIDWMAVAAQVPNILTLVLVTLLCVVMYVGGLEVASSRELDWNREFGAIGLAGAAAGLGGGPPSCPVVPTSLRSLMFGVDVRATGVVAALVVGSPLLIGDAVLNLVPVPLMGGVLLFTGIALLDQWLLKVRRRVPRTDYAIILAVFATILVFGFFEGVALGMIVTVVVFVFRIGRAGVVESAFTLREQQSSRSRPVPDRAILRAEGGKVRGYRLQGYLFFGGGYPLADRLKATLGEDPRPQCILLDFSAVTGLDISTVNAMCRFILAARGAGTEVVMGDAPVMLAGELQRNLPPAAYGKLVFAPDSDSALAHCEDRLLAAWQPDGDGPVTRSALLDAVAGDMDRFLDRQELFEDLIDALADWVEPLEYGAGEALLSAGGTSDALQLILAGRVSVLDAEGVRIRQIGPGEAVEPHAPFNARVAGVTAVADSPCRTATLSSLALHLLEESDRELAVRLYRYVLSDSGAQNARAPRSNSGSVGEQP